MTYFVMPQKGQEIHSHVTMKNVLGSGFLVSGQRWAKNNKIIVFLISSLQCSKTCNKGHRRRSVSCEWLKGGLAPSLECGHEERPASIIDCFGPACHDLSKNIEFQFESNPKIVISPFRDGRETSPCQDTSKFCGLIKTYKMCQSEKFLEQCCQTCKAL